MACGDPLALSQPEMVVAWTRVARWAWQEMERILWPQGVCGGGQRSQDGPRVRQGERAIRPGEEAAVSESLGCSLRVGAMAGPGTCRQH